MSHTFGRRSPTLSEGGRCHSAGGRCHSEGGLYRSEGDQILSTVRKAIKFSPPFGRRSNSLHRSEGAQILSTARKAIKFSLSPSFGSPVIGRRAWCSLLRLLPYAPAHAERELGKSQKAVVRSCRRCTSVEREDR